MPSIQEQEIQHLTKKINDITAQIDKLREERKILKRHRTMLYIQVYGR